MSDKKLRFKGLSKKTKTTSVDGFVPRRRAQTVNHPLVDQQPRVAGGPRRPLAQRQIIPTETLEVPDEDDQSPLLGNFDQPENDVFADRDDDNILGTHRRRGGKSDDDGKKRGRLRTWWKDRSLKFKIAFVSLLVIIGLGSFAGIRLYSFLNSVFGRGVGNKSTALKGEIRPEDLNTEGDGRLNILLLGRGGVENAAPDLTDTIIVASIDLKNQTASMLSIPRDTYVDGASDNSKINGVFARNKEQAIYKGANRSGAEDEGIKSAIQIARKISGVPIHKYVLTDYKAFRDVVNALGGVTVNVPTSINDYFAKIYIKKGVQTMNGDRALAYARTRHGSARGDFDRNENQRRLLIAMRAKATSTGIVANPVKLNSLANAIQKNIRTDLSLDEAKTLFEKTKTLPEASIKSLDLADPNSPLIMTGMVNGQSIVRPIAGIEDYTKIRAYARTNMIDPYLKKEAPSVAVYNGSGKTGLATLVGDVMAGYGYNILDRQTSKQIQTKTIVVRLNKDTKRPFSERFLSLRFKAVITSSLPSGFVLAPIKTVATTTKTTTSSTKTPTTAPQPDYVVILGTDFRATGSTW